ncbi:MAG: MATE family efflux transporter [Sedimentisphaerales bacterium]|nr:MATE family efflux transporter [Sedimentisphaerales bacterium]
MSKLVKDSVLKTMIRMAVPMLAGTFALNAYNLTDTWFVSRLGTDNLAAMSYTFPVVMLLGFVLRGISTGSMALVAHALGGKRQKTAARLTTHAIFLTSGISIIILIAGFLTVNLLFATLGASGEVLVLTRKYMYIWYGGIIFLSVQILICDIIIGTGNTIQSSLLMVSGTLANVVLDYIMIFGHLGFPAMGIRGAALATISAQTLVLLAALYIVHHKHGLITLVSFNFKRILISWYRILRMGIPSVLSTILTPISAGVVTRIVSGYGDPTVAACGVASRIEMFAFMIPMTVGMSMVPFVAQNFGAKRFDRIRIARRGAMIFALVFGFAAAGVFFVTIKHLAVIFTSDPEVENVLIRYICITCFGYGFLEVHRYAGFCMTGIHEPLISALLNMVRVFALLVPLSLLGSITIGLSGVFYGRLLTDILSGIIGVIWSGRVLKSKVSRAILLSRGNSGQLIVGSGN